MYKGIGESKIGKRGRQLGEEEKRTGGMRTEQLGENMGNKLTRDFERHYGRAGKNRKKRKKTKNEKFDI